MGPHSTDGIAAAGHFNFDYVSTKVGHDSGCPGRGDNCSDIENANTFKSFSGHLKFLLYQQTLFYGKYGSKLELHSGRRLAGSAESFFKYSNRPSSVRYPRNFPGKLTHRVTVSTISFP
jgi:hypothetical protein